MVGPRQLAVGGTDDHRMRCGNDQPRNHAPAPDVGVAQFSFVGWRDSVTCGDSMSDEQVILQGIEKLGTRLDRLENRLSTIEGVGAEVDARLKSWPDMQYLAAAAKPQMAHTRELKADVADIKVRMGEIYQAMATD